MWWECFSFSYFSSMLYFISCNKSISSTTQFHIIITTRVFHGFHFYVVAVKCHGERYEISRKVWLHQSIITYGRETSYTADYISLLYTYMHASKTCIMSMLCTLMWPIVAIEDAYRPPHIPYCGRWGYSCWYVQQPPQQKINGVPVTHKDKARRHEILRWDNRWGINYYYW